IHGVQHVFHAPAWLKRWPSDDRSSRIVFITRRVPRRWMEALFEAIVAEVADVTVGRQVPRPGRTFGSIAAHLRRRRLFRMCAVPDMATSDLGSNPLRFCQQLCHGANILDK